MLAISTPGQGARLQLDRAEAIHVDHAFGLRHDLLGVIASPHSSGLPRARYALRI
jgi:hypothetical protein